jgi:hypothetical protein
MSDEAWCLLESCWTTYANIRPDLPHIREGITTLKKAHDISATHDISRPQPLRQVVMSRKPVRRKQPSTFSSHPSASDMFSDVPSASGRVAPLRYRYLGRPVPVHRRPSPYNPSSGRDSISARVTGPQCTLVMTIRYNSAYINHTVERVLNSSTWAGVKGKNTIASSNVQHRPPLDSEISLPFDSIKITSGDTGILGSAHSRSSEVPANASPMLEQAVGDTEAAVQALMDALQGERSQ